MSFKHYSVNPTSLKLELGKEFDINQVQKLFLLNIRKWLEYYRADKRLDVSYLQALFNKDEVSVFQQIPGDKFSGIIRGVTDSGMIMIDIKGSIKEFNMNEVRLLL